MIPLYKKLLGKKYEQLPPAIQQLHNLTGNADFAGIATVERGSNLLARMTAGLLGLPKPGADIPVHVNFDVNENREIWTRTFGAKKFRSHLSQHGNLLREQLNFSTVLFFKLQGDSRHLAMELQQVTVFGLPLIKLLRPKVLAIETQQGDDFYFTIDTSLPLFGRLVAYRGFLRLC